MPRDGTAIKTIPGRVWTWRDGIYTYDPSNRVYDPEQKIWKIASTRWFPSPHAPQYGGRLLGSVRLDPETKERTIVRPSLAECIAIFHEMLDIVTISRNWSVLQDVVTYRREVSNVPIESIDTRILQLLQSGANYYSAEAKVLILERMPCGHA